MITQAGFGVDVHAFGDDPPIRLLGVVADDSRGLEGHSDGDAAAHAVIDSLLGAAGLGDIGMRYPSSDSRWADADSMAMLAEVVSEVQRAGFSVVHVDVTVVAQDLIISPVRSAMTTSLQYALHGGTVSIKATTTDHLGALGRGEGIAVYSIATLSYDA